MKKLLLLTTLSLAAAAVAQPVPPTPIAATPESMVWKSGPPTLPSATEVAILEGDPKLDGMFTMRIRVPAGSRIAPHWHPRHERVTVLSGLVELGFGNKADPVAVKRFVAGSFYVNPPRVMHYLAFPEETVLQMTGVGPWELFTTDITAPNEAPAAAVRILNVRPPARSTLSADSTIKVEFAYEIRNFRPDTFSVSIQFETNDPRKTFAASKRTVAKPGTPSTPPRPLFLTAASGTQTLTYDLGDIWGHRDLKQPIRLRIYIHELTSDVTSNVAGMSEWIEYN